MQAAILSRPRWAGIGPLRLPRQALVLAAAFVLTLVPELLLVERKFAIFGGGFGQPRTLDGPLELIAFAVGLGACQLLMLYAVLRLLARVQSGAGDRLLCFNFLFVVTAGGLALAAARFQLLSYFSDAVSFQIIRNLSGGSLVQAFLYVLSEAGLLLVAGGGAILVYLILLRLLRRRWPADSAAPGRRNAGLARFALFALATFCLLFAANRVEDVRHALARFNATQLVGAGLAELTDVDRDGYGLFSAYLDPHPFDPARHPLALDVPGNGIDEDGFGGDLAAFRTEVSPATPALAGAKKHVVLIVLESTRGDVMGKSFGGRLLAPNMAALAAEGSQVREAYSHVGFTTASLKSLFSGVLEPGPDSPSLFRDFKSNGYKIGVFSGQAERFGDIESTVGMRRNSDVFVDAETLKEERAGAFTATASLLVDGQILLREFDRAFGRLTAWQKPAFLYFNFQSSHFPYHNEGVKAFLPGEPIPRAEIGLANKAWVARTYWNSVAYGDWLVGRVVARLKALGQYDDTLVVVTADHGESLFDDGFLGHGHMLNRQQTHIPLVLNAKGADAAGPVGLTDMRGLILGLQRGRGAVPRDRPVFQYLGTLDQPGAIGMVERGGVWTILDFATREIRFSDQGAAIRYTDLPRTGPLRARAEQLVASWGRERWRRHLETGAK